MKMSLSVIIRLCVFYVLLNSIAYAQTEPVKDHWTPKDNDLRILEVRIESFSFEDVIPAYQYQDVVLLPLGTLSDIMELAITLGDGTAQGFVIREDRTFFLDIARNEIVIKGKPEKFDASLVHDLGDDIYVESNLLGRWLYMDFNIDLYSAIVKIKSDEKLPFLQKMEREARSKLALSQANKGDVYYPKHREPYKMASVPFLDQSITLGRQKNAGTEAFNKYQYTTYASADLLKHEAAVYLSGNEQKNLDEFRMRLGRKDAEGDLLGFMKATEYAVGSVTETRVNFINQPSEIEPGISVGNYALGQQREYDRHRFIGVLLPGWEVELYRNNSIIGYQPLPIDGLYDFKDVPLLFGNNHFRLVFYGPNGQIREEDQFFQLDQSLTKKGEHKYHLTATDDEEGGNRATIQYDYGLSKNISTTLNYVDIPLDGPGGRIQHQYLRAGLRGFWQSFFLDLGFYDDSESGDAVELSLNARYDSTVFTVKDAMLNDFFSEEFSPSAVPVSRRSEASLDTAIPPTFIPRIPLNFKLVREEFSDGGERLDFSNTISVSARGFALSNQVHRISGTNRVATANGSFQFSLNIDRVRLRSVLSYDLEPTGKLTNASITADPGVIGDYQISMSVNHSLAINLTEYSISANKSAGDYSLSFGARYNSDDEFNLDMRLSFGFGYEPRRGNWQSDAIAIANQGSISARAFQDNDQDGIFGENDEPLENIGFRLNNGYTPDKTDEDGIVFITGIQPYQSVNVIVAPETLEDPLWNAAIDGINVLPRPGNSIVIDFPIFMTGEIDGTVYLSKAGQTFGVGNVEVELVDKAGRVLQTVETAYDGFYIISKVSFGEYRIRIAESQIDKLNLQAVSDEHLELNSDEPFQSGFDFTLRSK